MRAISPSHHTTFISTGDKFCRAAHPCTASKTRPSTHTVRELFLTQKKVRPSFTSSPPGTVFPSILSLRRRRRHLSSLGSSTGEPPSAHDAVSHRRQPQPALTYPCPIFYFFRSPHTHCAAALLPSPPFFPSADTAPGDEGGGTTAGTSSLFSRAKKKPRYLMCLTLGRHFSWLFFFLGGGVVVSCGRPLLSQRGAAATRHSPLLRRPRRGTPVKT